MGAVVVVGGVLIGLEHGGEDVAGVVTLEGGGVGGEGAVMAEVGVVKQALDSGGHFVLVGGGDDEALLFVGDQLGEGTGAGDDGGAGGGHGFEAGVGEAFEADAGDDSDAGVAEVVGDGVEGDEAGHVDAGADDGVGDEAGEEVAEGGFAGPAVGADDPELGAGLAGS